MYNIYVEHRQQGNLKETYVQTVSLLLAVYQLFSAEIITGKTIKLSVTWYEQIWDRFQWKEKFTDRNSKQKFIEIKFIRYKHLLEHGKNKLGWKSCVPTFLS